MESHPQNWSVVQDHRGVIYVGNNTAVAEYDGVSWRSIPLGSTARSLAVNSNGRVFIGAENDLGYLSPDSTGLMRFISLKEKIAEKDRDFYAILNIEVCNEPIYFFGFRKLLVYENDTIIALSTAKTDFRFGYYVNGRIFVYQSGIGLMELVEDSLQLAPGGEFFAGSTVYVMLPIKDSQGENKILICTKQEMYVYDTDSETNSIEHFQSDVCEYVRQKHVYRGILLADGNIALASNYGGVIIINQAGDLISLTNMATGLIYDELNYVYADNRNNLWTATNKGVSCIEYSSPITKMDESDGYKGMIISMLKYNNQMVIGAMQGSFSITKNRQIDKINKHYIFTKLNDSKNNFMDLDTYKDKLFAATKRGLMQFSAGEFKYIHKEDFGFSVHNYRKDSSLLFLGNREGLSILELEDNQWKYKGHVKGLETEIRAPIFEDNDGNIWGTITNSRGLFRLSLNRQGSETDFIVSLYDTTNGLPSQTIFLPLLYDNTIYVASFAGNYKFNQDEKDPSKAFTPDSTLYIVSKEDTVQIVNLFPGDAQQSWVITRDGEMGLLTKEKDNRISVNTTPFKRTSVSVSFDIFHDTLSKLVYYSQPECLYCYNTQKKADYEQAYNTLIRLVSTVKDSVLYFGSYREDIKNPVLPYSKNLMKFEFAAPIVMADVETAYSYILEGFDKEWSDYKAESSASYTNIPEGEYIFKVKAKNIYDIESEIASYSFSILPPWYRSIWAYLSYFIASLVFVYLIVKINSRRLVAANIRLENTVKERTAEILEQKEEIMVQNEEILQRNEEINAQSELLEEINKELEKKNVHITDSLLYAKRIQDAILPPVNNIQALLPESFVFFQPKDIVSGDFYWFHTTENLIFYAVADCTGHGVPGAFMSMIGNSLLNDIVKERKHTQPSEILSQLNKGVKKVFIQNDCLVNSQDDGMDISLCCIDLQNSCLTLSLANHYSFIIRDGELEQINGDLYSIGGPYLSKEDAVYTDQSFPIEANMMLFMFSDGFIDQFGGPDYKKYSAGKFRKLCTSLYNLSATEQEEKIAQTYDEWKGKGMQLDDVLVAGIKFIPFK